MIIKWKWNENDFESRLRQMVNVNLYSVDQVFSLTVVYCLWFPLTKKKMFNASFVHANYPGQFWSACFLFWEILNLNLFNILPYRWNQSSFACLLFCWRWCHWMSVMPGHVRVAAIPTFIIACSAEDALLKVDVMVAWIIH